MLSLVSISKYFPGIKALSNVSLQLEPGKIYGLVGENGAGKSTLLKILMGVYKPDEGYIIVRGKKFRYIDNPYFARKQLKIDAVFQEPCLVDNLSVAENLYIDRLEEFGKGLLLNKRLIEKESEKVLKNIGEAINVNQPAGSLRIDVKKIVEFSRLFITNPDIILLDEITAPLDMTKVKRLFTLIRNFKESGKTVVFVSHRLGEVFEISDEIIVLRDGKVAGTVSNEGAIQGSNMREKVIKMMSGVEIGLVFPEKKKIEKPQKLILRVKGLSNEYLKGVDLDLHEGEIVALAGLSGHGQSMLIRTLAGLVPKRKGEVYIEGNLVDIRSPKDAVKNGLLYLSDKKEEEELWLHHNLIFNICYPSVKERSTLSFVKTSVERRLSKEITLKLRIQTPSLAQPLMNLSGGNRQKVVLGRKLLCRPKILLLDQPTMGIDLSTKKEVYFLIRRLASEERISILTVLSDLPEIINIPDRILVMRGGVIVKQFPAGVDEDVLLDSYFG
jgi:ABC-type sugar transport system ATPase subunit